VDQVSQIRLHVTTAEHMMNLCSVTELCWACRLQWSCKFEEGM